MSGLVYAASAQSLWRRYEEVLHIAMSGLAANAVITHYEFNYVWMHIDAAFALGSVSM